MNAQSVNRAIKRIASSYNATEEVEARKEHREPVLLPNFSAHNLRHTFCTRLCERETNLKAVSYTHLCISQQKRNFRKARAVKEIGKSGKDGRGNKDKPAID